MNVSLKYSVALAIACLSVGCQLPATTEVEFPKTEAYRGKLVAQMRSRLALDVNLRPLLAAANFSVQSLDDTHIVVKVLGDGLAEPQVASVRLADCSDGTAHLQFDALPSGLYVVHAAVKNAAGVTLAYASDPHVEVSAGANATVSLVCQTGDDSACEPTCATPTPVPTPTPTPTPSATPTPTPTPTVATVTSLTFLGRDLDVGSPFGQSPDGNKDALFSVGLYLPKQKVLRRVNLTRAGLIPLAWGWAPGGLHNDPLRMPLYPVTKFVGAHAGTETLQFRAVNAYRSGNLFAAGDRFTLDIELTDGTTLSRAVTLP